MALRNRRKKSLIESTEDMILIYWFICSIRWSRIKDTRLYYTKNDPDQNEYQSKCIAITRSLTNVEVILKRIIYLEVLRFYSFSTWKRYLKPPSRKNKIKKAHLFKNFISALFCENATLRVHINFILDFRWCLHLIFASIKDPYLSLLVK